MKNVLSILFSSILLFVSISDTSAENIDKSDWEFNSSLVVSTPALVDTTTDFNLTLCSGEAIEINGAIYDESNPFGTEVFIGSNGCDSTVIINLEFVETISISLNPIVCFGDTYIVNGTTYDENNPTGTEVLEGLNGCDSIININLSILEIPQSILSLFICSGDSVIINGTIYDDNNSSGTEILLGAGANGCDSIVTVNLFILLSPTTFISEHLCLGDSIIINGNIYTENNPSGTEILAGASANGCDSIIEVDLNFIDPNFTVDGLDMSANFSDATSYQWILNGNPIPGATNNTWSAEENGIYTLQIESNGVTCISDNVTVEYNSVYEISQDPRIKIYPNPIQDHIFIDLSDDLRNKIIRYELFNLQGQLVQKGMYQNKINLESSVPGIFIFRLIDVDQNIYIQKLKT